MMKKRSFLIRVLQLLLAATVLGVPSTPTASATPALESVSAENPNYSSSASADSITKLCGPKIKRFTKGQGVKYSWSQEMSTGVEPWRFREVRVICNQTAAYSKLKWTEYVGFRTFGCYHLVDQVVWVPRCTTNIWGTTYMTGSYKRIRLIVKNEAIQ